MDIPQIHSLFLGSSGISTDTRKILPNSIFVALRGDNFDANAFAADALDKGATHVLIDNADYYIDDRTIVVPDTLDALQQLALFHRRYLKIPIVALTGSNGKTTTKELINVVLSQKFHTKATVGNLNNHIGVPLTLLSFDHSTEIGVVEMGANHQGEIAALCQIAEPDFGYITNFGKAHLEGFGGVEGVIKGKSELYKYLADHKKTAFIDGDDLLQIQNCNVLSKFTFATTNADANMFVSDVSFNPFVQLTVGDTAIKSNLIGHYNATNIAAAVAIGKYFGVAMDDSKAAIENYVPTNNRSQFIERNDVTILLDAYNANPTSMAAAISNFATLVKSPKSAIIGDMFELGVESAVEHASIIRVVQQHPEITWHLIGKEFYQHKSDLRNLHFYPDYDSFAKTFSPVSNGMVLIKGSRGMALERALDFF